MNDKCFDYYFLDEGNFDNLESAKRKLAEKKKEVRDNTEKDKDTKDFYPKPEDLQNLPENSLFIKISFILKKPYISKDEGEFHIIDGKIFENAIIRDKFTKLPMVRPSIWKGHLRFAAERVKWEKDEDKKKIIQRLFGSESDEEESLKGRLYFFPTFFGEDAKKDVITPLKRDTRTPARGPINLEIMKSKSKGDFYLLYIPYPEGKGLNKEQVKEDLRFLSEALRLMFHVYGFSAKKTSGFGVIEDVLNEGKIWMKSGIEIKEETFSRLDNMKSQLIKLPGDER